MPNEKAYAPLSKILFLPDGKTDNKIHIKIILAEEIPVFCINKDSNKTKLMPFKVLYDNNENFWKQRGNWDYFLTKEGFAALKEKAAEKENNLDFISNSNEKQVSAAEIITAEEPKIEPEDLGEPEPVEVGFGNDSKNITEMSAADKIEFLNKNNERLGSLLQKNMPAEVINEIIVETARDTILVNHAFIEDTMNLSDSEAKNFTKDMVASTHEMIKLYNNLLKEDFYGNELMKTIANKTNGTIVQHMIRVYYAGSAFLAYYNKLVSTSSAIQKIRISFPAKYKKFYHSLLPHLHIDDVNPERIFYGGMRAISPELINNWTVGFFVHDIGKATAVEYHEGEAEYNRNIVIEHVKLGYNYIMKKTNYPIEAGLITGYHHEYYGSADGYGYFRAYLQQYKKLNPEARQDYCIAYDREPVLDFKALSYFPAKVLEIVDIYDSLTDPHRVYRKPMAPEEAVMMMREQFIEKNPKIDIILFDIFAMYIEEQENRKNK